MRKTLPTFFLSHGGGPWPWMKEDMPGVFNELERSLKAIPGSLPVKPQAILVVTSHWVGREFSVSAHPQPGMIYDYSGFPEKYYHVNYRAPGSPTLANRIHALLQAAGLPSSVDLERGFDHGTYTVAMPMYPNADVPVVQLSIHKKFDPELHLQAGRALRSLRDEGVLILGSGLSYHNLALFGPQGALPSQAFDHWLQETMTLPPAERSRRLIAWTSAPAARTAHPREDHLLPLMIAVGAAEDDDASLVYHEDEFMGGITVSSFRFR